MLGFPAWAEKNRTLWTRVYDEVIAPQLEEELKKRDEDHKSKLRDKDERIGIEMAMNKRLRDENECLKGRLNARGHDAVPSTEQQSILDLNVIGPINDYHHLTEKYNELSKKYSDASQKLKYLERKNDSVMQKFRDMKESVRLWQEYCDRQNERQRPKPETKANNSRTKPLALGADDVPSSPMSPASVKTPRHLAESEDLSPTPTAPMHRPGRTIVEQTTPKEIPNEDVECFLQNNYEDIIGHSVQVGPLEGQLNRNIPNSSQTTEDELAEHKSAPVRSSLVTEDDDIPIFVSERSLKRKLDASTLFDIYTDRPNRGTSEQPIQIKEEQRSSPPPMFLSLQRKETVDLDEPGPNVLATPRRKNRIKKTIHSNLTGTLQHQRSTSAPFTQRIKTESTHEDIQVTLNDSHTQNQAEKDSAIAKARALSAPINDVLQPLDPNALEIKPEASSNKRPKLSELHRQQKHDALTESGESAPSVYGHEKRLSPSLARFQFNRKLQASKNSTRIPTSTSSFRTKAEQLPNPHSSTSHTIDTPSNISKSRQRPSISRPESPEDSTTDSRPVWRMQPPETHGSARKTQAPMPKRLVPLRSRPLEDLSVQDFKPNPAFNQGYSFAFSETVRKRGDRACLPGCTNPQCCGSAFRTLASAAPPLSSSQEEKLLEDYLGDAHNNMRLTQMASEEREELVLQARTRMMAKDHGKHRQAYEGRRTPPGYWRIDFPSTQEQEDDRKTAREQERSVVQDRWMEAMRKGGKWVFRDE